jgi:hypothetical protein
MNGSFQRRIAELEEKLNRISTGSSKSPSSDPPAAEHRTPSPPSDRRWSDSLAKVGWAKPG